MTMIRVTIWNEFRHERLNPVVAAIYPNGIHEAIRAFLKDDSNYIIHTSTLDEPECGLTEELLNDTDVLVWWGHKAHREVSDEAAERVVRHVQGGMGLVALHSAHESKPFIRLMGTTCSLKWRKSGEKERLWNVAPTHPIMKEVGDYFELEHVEMYGERFDVPKPDDVLMISWYPGGEIFRSCCTWTRGNGRIVHFKPGHETFPIYENPNVQLVIRNAVNWAAPAARGLPASRQTDPLEMIEQIEC